MSTHNIYFYGEVSEAILMSTHNIYFYGELMKIVLQLSSNTHLICSSDYESPKACVKYCVGCLGAWYFSEGSIELSAISRQFMI